MKRVSMIASGRVQGVGFRAYVQHVAQNISINGWVKNLTDGTVEIEAEGPDDVVERFISIIASTNERFMNVEDLKTHHKAYAGLSGFIIKRD